MGRSGLVVAGARACIGARFLPQGRDPLIGLDCVGLVAFAFAAAGVRAELPHGYAMRGGSQEAWRAEIARTALRPVAGATAGDLLLLEPGPRQFHLAVHSGGGIIHAHAGLRRVVEMPGPPPWPVRGCWRLDKEN